MHGESPHVHVKEPYSSFQSAKPVCTMYACSLSLRDPSDRDVNLRPPVQGESPHVQVKEPYRSLHDYL